MTSYAGAAHSSAAVKDNSIRGAVSLSSSNKRMLKLVLIGLLAIFVMVGLQAYTATLQYANNLLSEENEYLQAEIDSINSQIVEETKVTKIEKTARKKYGMVYPTSENCVTIHEEEELGDNLAATIRSEAYN